MIDRGAVETFAGAFWGAYALLRALQWALQRMAEWQGRREARRTLQNYTSRR